MKSHGAKRKRKGSPSSRKKSWCEGCFLASNSHFPLTRPLQRMLALQQQIASFVGAVSAQRGLQYYREGKAELDTVSSHQGTRADEVDQVVRGHVAGSSFAPYQAWASVSGGTILDAHCSCPIGSKGSFSCLPKRLLRFFHTLLPSFPCTSVLTLLIFLFRSM